MDLVDVNVIRAQAPQALFNGESNVLRRKVLGQFFMAVPFAGVIVEVVTELGGDDDTVTNVAEGVCEYRLPFALPIRIGRVEEGHAGIVGLPQ